MNSRHSRTPPRAAGALIHRGPQAMSAAPQYTAPIHAPNAALLIDFDNVTMGIRSELQKELQNLLSSDIIKGKVAVRRAYADWRRYPLYIVPLTEASIDLIFAPAYGSAKKNATDIRLAIDAMELVFTRPEIGTFVLLSGDSDFSSMVIKLKEYGKYVIGIGIRESSSDLLVQNCDEYYSYNALAGLVRASEDEPVRKYDPWELVTEAVQRMKRNNDVMRSDRLKQVMQEIDSSFDEKNQGYSKFSRFCQEAAQKGLLSITKLDNGQLEVDLPATTPATSTHTVSTPVSLEAVADEPAAESHEPVAAAENREAREPREEREERGARRRRGRGGRGRDREDRPPRDPREERTPAVAAEASVEVQPAEASVIHATPPVDLANEARVVDAGNAGERLTRAEAFDLVRRTVDALVKGDETVRASDVRARARQLLGRDSESLSDRMFVRILKDAHDEGLIDLRRRGNDFEVARAAEAASVADQIASNERAAAAAAAPAIPATPAPRLGMGPRAVGGRGRAMGAPPPNLLAIGVVGGEKRTPAAAPVPSTVPATPAVASGAPSTAAKQASETPAAKRGRGPRAKTAAKTAEPAKTAKRGAKKAASSRPRAKKTAAAVSEE